jgi:hypothetical protein
VDDAAEQGAVDSFPLCPLFSWAQGQGHDGLDEAERKKVYSQLCPVFFEVIRDFCEKSFHFCLSLNERSSRRSSQLQELAIAIKIWYQICFFT